MCLLKLTSCFALTTLCIFQRAFNPFSRGGNAMNETVKVLKKKRRRCDLKIVTKEGKILKFLRESRRLSMRQAAKLVNVSVASINHLENGRMDISTKLILQLLDAYIYTYEDFIKMQSPEYSLPQMTLDECITILKRLEPEKLRKVKLFLETF